MLVADNSKLENGAASLLHFFTHTRSNLESSTSFALKLNEYSACLL